MCLSSDTWHYLCCSDLVLQKGRNTKHRLLYRLNALLDWILFAKPHDCDYTTPNIPSTYWGEIDKAHKMIMCVSWMRPDSDAIVYYIASDAHRPWNCLSVFDASAFCNAFLNWLCMFQYECLIFFSRGWYRQSISVDTCKRQRNATIAPNVNCLKKGRSVIQITALATEIQELSPEKRANWDVQKWKHCVL